MRYLKLEFVAISEHRAGRIDGLAVYFRTTVDDDLHLSSAPHDPGRAPHWGFRILRTEPADYAMGDVIEIKLTVGRWHELESWRWSHTLALQSAA